MNYILYDFFFSNSDEIMILDEKSSSSSERPKSVITLERVTNEEEDDEVKEKVIETKLTNFKETWMFSPKKDKDSSEEPLKEKEIPQETAEEIKEKSKSFGFPFSPMKKDEDDDSSNQQKSSESIVTDSTGVQKIHKDENIPCPSTKIDAALSQNENTKNSSEFGNIIFCVLITIK